MSSAQTHNVAKVCMALVELLQMCLERMAESSDYMEWAQTFGEQLGMWHLILQGAQLPADPQIETEVEEVIEALLPASEVHWLEWADEVFPELAMVIQGHKEEHWAAKEANTAKNVQDSPVVLQFPAAQVSSIAEEEPSGPHRSLFTHCLTAPGAATSVSESVSDSTGKGISVVRGHRSTEAVIDCGSFIGELVYMSKGKGCATLKAPVIGPVQLHASNLCIFGLLLICTITLQPQLGMT
ncbi:hypothetical protein AcV5_007942 [Taiwanofungus camphoratus]|nr:hypothetical protein AcV5_007942 [Antrodia cinnamomea]